MAEAAFPGPWRDYRRYRVSPRSKEPLLDFLIRGLEESRCRILSTTDPSEAPFRISFETPYGERVGVVAYAFYANRRETKNRPSDEWRFQIGYSSGNQNEHEIWQDPAGLHVTLLVGINPGAGFFVGVDPSLHDPVERFTSIGFRGKNVADIERDGWTWWERQGRWPNDRVEVLIGGNESNVLRYILFEREALREEPGPRALIADRMGLAAVLGGSGRGHQ